MRFIVLAFALFVSSPIVAQSDKNVAYLEIGGNAFVYSINYERIIKVSENIQFLPRIGFSLIPQNIGLPLEANILFGQKKHFFETALGSALFLGREKVVKSNGDVKNGSSKIYNYFSGRLGYRYHAESGFVLRAGVVPLFNGTHFYPWAGFSLGRSF